MITTLDDKRQLDAEWNEHVRRKGPERNDGLLPIDRVIASPRVAADAAQAVAGPRGASLISALVILSATGVLNGVILAGPRTYYAMARDGFFFRRVAFVHPRHRTPSVSILLLSAWASLLVLSGRYDQLYTYVIFASAILYGMATAAVIVLRRKRPDLARPYRTLGYPIVPIAFVLGVACTPPAGD